MEIDRQKLIAISVASASVGLGSLLILTQTGAAFMSFALLGSLAIFIARVLRGMDGPSVPEVLLPVFTCSFGCVYLIISLVYKAKTLALDEVLYLFDRSLGFEASFALGNVLAYHPALCLATYFVYMALPFAQGALYACLSPKERWHFSYAAIGLGAVGFLLHKICPGTGPLFAFGTFPWAEPALSNPAPLDLKAALNAMPSLHMAWALLILWYGLKCSWPVRIGSAVFAALTAFATLGLGEHYLIDLIVAAPVTAAVDVIVRRENAAGRRDAILTLALIAAFLFTLRTTWVLKYPVASWPIVCLMLGLTARLWFGGLAAALLQSRQHRLA